MPPTEAELADAVHRAARAALLGLFREHPTTGSATAATARW
ncbi:hypothetical protein [Streptomyces sp. NPDC058985]